MSRVDDQSRYSRIEGIVPVPHLARRRATLLGMGSMGNPIAMQLARHGVGTVPPGRIRIADGDVVEARNLIGTEYRMEHLARSKAEASAQAMQAVNPHVNLSVWRKRIGPEDLTHVEEWARQSDLLCDFADDFELLPELSRRCYGICPMVTAIFGPKCDFAEVAFSVPNLTPPLHETLGKRQRQSIAKPQALGCDTLFVASFVTSLCLRLLLGNDPGGDVLTCYSNAPLIVIGVRPVWIFANQSSDIARSIVHVGMSPRATPQVPNQRR